MSTDPGDAVIVRVPGPGGVDDPPDGGSDVVDVPGVSNDHGGPGGTAVADVGADGEDGGTYVDVGTEGGAVDVDMVVVGANGCGGVDDYWIRL